MSGQSDEQSGTQVVCSVCGVEVGRGPGGLGLIQHAKTHRREFGDRYGRPPEDYDEVREKLGAPGIWEGDQLTLWESLLEDEQASMRTVEER